MRRLACWMVTSGLAVLSMAGLVTGNDQWGLDKVGPQLSSAGPLAFGPDSILLLGDAKQAAVFAIATDDSGTVDASADLNVADLLGEIASTVGVNAEAVSVNDLATNPETGNVFLTVHVKKDSASEAQLWKVQRGALQKVDLTKASYAKLEMPNPPADKMVGNGNRQRNPRDESITGLTYSKGRVLVSGLSASDEPSSVWEFQFPFGDTNSAVSVEIYHAAHGRYEDNAAIRSFVTMDIGGKPTLLAGYTCTPLVKLPLDTIEKGEKVRGTTVAELGNYNRPLDMLVYEKDNQTYVLMANSARGTLKISTENIEQNAGLSEPVKGGGTAGQSFEKVPMLDNLLKMDHFGNDRFVALVKSPEGVLSLSVRDLP